MSFYGRILVVEDDPIISLDTADTLSDLGFDDVLVAASAGEALARIAETPDLRAVVLDLDLKGESAAPVAAAARATGTPVVVASGHASGYTAVDGETMLAGAARLVKPYSVEALRDALADVLATAPATVST